jgi:hypothetical protein
MVMMGVKILLSMQISDKMHMKKSYMPKHEKLIKGPLYKVEPTLIKSILFEGILA